MSDLVNRLRLELNDDPRLFMEADVLMMEAADEIERLTKERDELVEVMDYRCGRYAEELAAVTRERDELRYGNAIKYGMSHPEMYKTELDYCKEQLAACQKDAEHLRYVIRRASKIMHGDGVMDQGEAWDKALALLDESVAAMKEQRT